MGYFSNGTDGDCYQEEFCDKCVHQEGGCAVWQLHLRYNSDQCDKTNAGAALKDVLDTLIPRPGVFSEKCRMFVPKVETAP